MWVVKYYVTSSQIIKINATGDFSNYGYFMQKSSENYVERFGYRWGINFSYLFLFNFGK